MNSITVVGNITRDTELKYLGNGQAMLKLSVASNRRFQKDGQWQDSVSYFDAVCWGDLAENVSATVSKGMRVVVSGRLEQRSWEDKDSGQKRSTVEIVADEVAPSLRWARASVERLDGGDRPKAKAAPSLLNDEEPF